MDSSFGVLDAIAFLVFAVLIAVAIVIIIFLGQLPGRLARRREHPQAAAITVTSWLGLATLGLLWPIALIWAFIIPGSTPPLESESDGNAERRLPASPPSIGQLRP